MMSLHRSRSRTTRTRKAHMLVAALLTLVAIVPARAHAQQAPAASAAPSAPSLQVVAENRTASAAAARGARRADSTVHSGDVVRYTLKFSNTAGRPVRAVAIQNPVPTGLQFVAGSAKSSRDDARAEYSVDGGKTWSARPMETVVVDGRQVERAVAPERYTAVRWVVSGWVQPTAVVTAEFEARLVIAPAKNANNTTNTPNAASSTPGAR